jgi:hypothetical protein
LTSGRSLVVLGDAEDRGDDVALVPVDVLLLLGDLAPLCPGPIGGRGRIWPGA